MNLFISDAFAQQAPAGGPPPAAGGGLFSLVLLVVMFVAFYFLLIRPQAKRAKEHRAMVAALAKGDEVVTAGGVLGRITKLDENYLSLEVADGVEIKVQRHAVQAVLPKGTLKSV
jgi:preprotein translocase subunit YajC